MAENFLENNLARRKNKNFKILIFFFFVFFSSQIFLNQSRAEDLNYKIEDSYVEVQQKAGSQIIALTKKENNKEEIAGNFRIEDDYLISDLPENEFLEKYSQLKSGFKDLKIKIEIDQPLFKKEKFYQPKNFLQKLTSLFSGENLPDYRLTKEIQDEAGNLETNAKISDLNFKTVYEEKEGKIKQSLLLENNFDREINFNLNLIHSINANNIYFNNKQYKISETPQFLSFEKGSSVSFSPIKTQNIGKRLIYDFSDLKDFKPEAWIFQENFNNFLLINIRGSVLPYSSTILDPFYTVSSTTESLAGAWSFQRKTWHDGTRYWASFFDGEGIKFWYSENGETWTENREASINSGERTLSNDYSINCDNSYCFIITAEHDSKPAYYVYAREAAGYPRAGFSWAEPFMVGSDENYSYNYVHLSRSLPSEYIWLTYELTGLFENTLYVQRSTDANSVSGGFEIAETISSSIRPYGLTVPSGSSSDYMLAIYSQGTTLLSRYFESSWSAATTIDYLYSTGLDDNFSAIYDDVNYNVHLLYNASGTSDNLIKYIYWDSAVKNWKNSASSTLASTSDSEADYCSISYDRVADRLHAFWIDIKSEIPTTYYIKQRTMDIGQEWRSLEELVTSSQALTWLTSNYFPYTGTENDLFLQYMRAQEGYYDINFHKIDGAVANATPSVGTVILNGGNAIILTENTTTTVQATATITDADGYADIYSVTGVIYRSGIGPSCTPNDNNCYADSACATSSCSSNSCVATCEYEVWFHADPTDASSSYPSEYWAAKITAIDKSEASGSATSSGVELNTLQALDISYLYERYSSGDTNYSAVGGTTWAAQTFTIGNTGTNVNHNIVNAKLNLGRQGSPGAGSILSIRATDSNGAPTGTDLTSVNFNGNDLPTSQQWLNFSLPSYQLSSSTKYALILRAPNGNVLTNFLKWYYDGTSPTYSSGSCYISDNSGSAWTAYADKDYMFEEFGSGGINYGNLNPGQDTGTLNKQNLILTTGNSAIDIYLYGTDLATGSYSIPVNKQQYATSALTYGFGTNATGSASNWVEVDLDKSISHYYSTSFDDIYWGIGIPTNTMPGVYTGTTTFEPKSD